MGKLLVYVMLLLLGATVSGSGSDRIAEDVPQRRFPPDPTDVKAEGYRKEMEANRQIAVASKWTIGIDIQMVAVERAKAVELLPRLQSGEQKEVDAAWNQLQDMIKTKEAILLGWPMVRTLDNFGGWSNHFCERTFPTEVETPFVILPPPPGSGQPPEEPPKPPPVDAATREGVPKVFESTRTGVSLDVDGAFVLKEGRQVYLRFRLNREDIAGVDDYGHVQTERNVLVPAPKPQPFEADSVVTGVFPNGRRQLLAVHPLTQPANYFELHLIRAVIRPAKP